jgi:hypothetical protein
MSTATLVLLTVFALLLIGVVLRLTVNSSIVPITAAEFAEESKNAGRGKSRFKFEASYQEVLNLADMTLDNGEAILAACGQRGEIENVLLATNRRLLFFTRRAGASRYYTEIFDYAKVHPIPLGQAVIGERLRVLEGERMAEMISPGNESWLDSAEDTIKAINEQIRQVRSGKR